MYCAILSFWLVPLQSSKHLVIYIMHMHQHFEFLFATFATLVSQSHYHRIIDSLKSHNPV